MNKETQPIDRETLLKEANKIITGDYFLDEQGLPTAKSTAVFNMFKHLAHVLSEKYHLVD